MLAIHVLTDFCFPYMFIWNTTRRAEFQPPLCNSTTWQWMLSICVNCFCLCVPPLSVPPRGPLPRPCIKVDIQAAVRKFVFQVYIVKTKVYTGLEVCWTLAVPNNAEAEFSGLMCLNVGNLNWQNPIYSVSKKVFCQRKTWKVFCARNKINFKTHPSTTCSYSTSTEGCKPGEQH